MFVLVKAVTLFVVYAILSVYAATAHVFPIGWRVFVTCTMIYYLILTMPSAHKVYEYNLCERVIPKTTYLYRCLFHYVLFSSNQLDWFPAVLSVLIIMLWKDVSFLIRHAENRLAKIDTAIYEAKIGMRLSHMYLNVFMDDVNNRFHEHCFDTNKIYFEQDSLTSDKMGLAIYNYRMMRSEKRRPKRLTSDESIAYAASSNKSMFVSQRWAFLASPLAILALTVIMSTSRWDTTVCINHLLIIGDVATFQLSAKTNDIFIDIAYAIMTIVGVYQLLPTVQ